MNRDKLLNGSVIKSLLAIALPVIAAYILQTVYQLIDTFWVGRLGTKAVAAVSLSFPILFLLISFSIGLSMAAAILIAQYNGKGDSKKVSLITGQAFSLILLLAIAVSIIGFLSSGFLLSLLTKDIVVLEQATSYLHISFIAIIAMFMFNVFLSSFRSIGEVKLPMIIILVTVILNFFLDPLLMFGWNFIPAMGVSGVALATLITESLAAIAGIIFLIKGNDGVRLRLSNMMPRLFWIKKIIRLGLPSSLEHSSRSLGMVLMIFIVSTFGTLAIASYGIGTRFLSFVIIPGIGFSISVSALIGNNLGAKQYARVEEIAKKGMLIGFFTLTTLGILLFIFAPAISAFFVPNEQELIVMSSTFVRIMALTFGSIGIQMVIFGTLKAAGKTTLSMFLAMVHTSALIIIAYLLSISLGLNELGIWIAYPIANIISLGLAFYFYQKKDWLNHKLI
ncbi:MATE family efflux transporter [Candidatus Woesearchaeota archaeon]|nr:MATE family efflux transporter [Candidatus Woesearchaeota archaeon]